VLPVNSISDFAAAAGSSVSILVVAGNTGTRWRETLFVRSIQARAIDARRRFSAGLLIRGSGSTTDHRQAKDGDSKLCHAVLNRSALAR
jgi:hypothetical protein